MRSRTAFHVVARSRRLASIAAAVVVVAVMSSGTAAHAIQEQYVSDCDSGLNGQTISFASGDTGRVRFLTCSSSPSLYLNSASPVGTSTSVIISGTTFNAQSVGGARVINVYDSIGGSYAAPADGTYVVHYEHNGNSGSFTVIVGTPASSSPPASSSSSGDSTAGAAPAPLLQEFGVPATGTCDEAQPEGLNWGGVASGGWSTVWGEWMHDGLGGWACSRTLSYSSALATWVVD